MLAREPISLLNIGSGLVAPVRPSHTPADSLVVLLAVLAVLAVLAAHHQSEAPVFRRQRSQTLHVESDQTPSAQFQKRLTQLNTPKLIFSRIFQMANGGALKARVRGS